MKLVLSVIVVFIVLYWLQVQVVVDFIDNLRIVVVPVWNTGIEEWTSLLDKHTGIYMGLVVLLGYLLFYNHAES